MIIFGSDSGCFIQFYADFLFKCVLIVFAVNKSEIYVFLYNIKSLKLSCEICELVSQIHIAYFLVKTGIKC